MRTIILTAHKVMLLFEVAAVNRSLGITRRVLALGPCALICPTFHRGTVPAVHTVPVGRIVAGRIVAGRTVAGFRD